MFMTIGHIVLSVNHLALLGRSLLLSCFLGHPLAAEWNLKLSTGIGFFLEIRYRKEIYAFPDACPIFVLFQFFNDFVTKRGDHITVFLRVTENCPVISNDL